MWDCWIWFWTWFFSEPTMVFSTTITSFREIIMLSFWTNVSTLCILVLRYCNKQCWVFGSIYICYVLFLERTLQQHRKDDARCFIQKSLCSSCIVPNADARLEWNLMHFGGIVKVRFSGWHLFLGVHCVFFFSLSLYIYMCMCMWLCGLLKITHTYIHIFFMYFYMIYIPKSCRFHF